METKEYRIIVFGAVSIYAQNTIEAEKMFNKLMLDINADFEIQDIELVE